MPQLRKKRKFELGRPAANTKIGERRIHNVRTRGGNIKFRAMRLDHGNFAWGSEGMLLLFSYDVDEHEILSIGYSYNWVLD